MRTCHRLSLCSLTLAAAMLAGMQGAAAQATSAEAARADSGASNDGVLRLRQSDDLTRRDLASEERRISKITTTPAPVYQATAFERFVQRSELSLHAQSETMRAQGDLSPPVRRLGANLMLPSDQQEAAESPWIPPDYQIKPGDEIRVTLWGSVDADLRLPVDRQGRITIPRVGPVTVAGVAQKDLPQALSAKLSQEFKNFQVSAQVAQLRGQRVFVSGFVERPGVYTVSSLSTVVHALMKAGGPSKAGSFRHIQVRRQGSAPLSMDLYDLILQGDRRSDLTLQPEDVIHVGPLGPQVAILGAVNHQAVVELKGHETLKEVLEMVGGMDTVADRSRITLQRLSERQGTMVQELALADQWGMKPLNGDILRFYSAVDAVLPKALQNRHVRIEGEVRRPGEYILPAGATTADAIAAAGGLTEQAFIYGTELNRESVKITQKENLARALRDLEMDISKQAVTVRTSNTDEATGQQAKHQAGQTLIQKLRQLEPTGRVVLELKADAKTLPVLALEGGDRIHIPARPTAVGVFGSVYNAGSFLYADGKTSGEYIAQAGGPTRGADPRSTFIVRANGTVISARQQGTAILGLTIGQDGSLNNARSIPGDSIFVPEEMNKTTFIQDLKDWAGILSQFGLGLAAIKVLGN